MKSFNIAGKCIPEEHYMLDPFKRGAYEDLLKHIRQKSYFVIHAPRQSGKTTFLNVLQENLNKEGIYTCLCFSCESGEVMGDDFSKVERRIVQTILKTAALYLPQEERPPFTSLEEISCDEGGFLQYFIMKWCEKNPKPLVLLFDEIDALRGDGLLTVLRQLREGYIMHPRPKYFPQSVVLCGLKDVRDYKIASGGSGRLGTASPFNISVDSIFFENFSLEEVKQLYLQHTEETGQKFTEEAFTKAYEYTQGQPWLVNALMREILLKMNITHTISPKEIEDAAKRIMVSRQTHIDSLISKLKEPRVKKIILPLIRGTHFEQNEDFDDDILYLRDLGLITRNPPVRISNPIYKEVILRTLGEFFENQIEFREPSFIKKDGTLHFDMILEEFSVWWRRNAEYMQKKGTYPEAASQLIFMAWLQRAVNGKGFVDREYGIGRGRIDIHLRWPIEGNYKNMQEEAIEIKVWREAKKKSPLQEGLEQLEKYLDRLSLKRGTLLIFDERPSEEPVLENQAKFEELQTPLKHYPVNLLWLS